MLPEYPDSFSYFPCIIIIVECVLHSLIVSRHNCDELLRGNQENELTARSAAGDAVHRLVIDCRGVSPEKESI